jgi:endonuclease/exonuclease/phosphatase family metal-dependent hydrolase
VNTHLEPSHPGIQVAQAEELLAGPMDTPLPVVLIGDLNSAAGGVGSPSPSDPPTYDNLIAAGFTDAWTATRGDRAGETWGHDEDLRNPEPHLSVRFDFILTRGDIAASTANLVGEKPGDRTPSGLWPSDHAGVWAVLHFRES